MDLIIGASGTLGSRIADKRVKAGKEVRGVTRSPEKLSWLQDLGGEVFRGDLRQKEWMEQACKGVENLIIVSHALAPPSRSNTIRKVDENGNIRLIDVAKQSGVNRIVFASTYFARPENTSRFGEIKYRIEEKLKQSGLNYTIIRPGAFIETHALDLMGVPLKNDEKVQLAGPGNTKINWISADDVADYFVRQLEKTGPDNEILTIGGPDEYTRLEVLKIIENALDKEAKRSHIPAGMMKMMRLASRPVHPGFSDLLDASLFEVQPANAEDWAPKEFDWVGSIRVKDVVLKWADSMETV